MYKNLTLLNSQPKFFYHKVIKIKWDVFENREMTRIREPHKGNVKVEAFHNLHSSHDIFMVIKSKR
jgi:hypothetical protein